MSNEVALMASLQDKVRERIQATFMELLPSELLSEDLKQIGLGPALPEQFEPVDTERPGVLVLNSGDY
jgi:hypothetical protein